MINTPASPTRPPLAFADAAEANAFFQFSTPIIDLGPAKLSDLRRSWVLGAELAEQKARDKYHAEDIDLLKAQAATCIHMVRWTIRELADPSKPPFMREEAIERLLQRVIEKFPAADARDIVPLDLFNGL